MSLEGSPLRNDIRNITTRKSLRGVDVTLDVHTKYGKLMIDDIGSIDILRDYVTNLGDKLIVKTRMFMGDYVKYILDSKDLMEAYIVWSKGKERYKRKYRASLQVDANNLLNQEQFSGSSVQGLNHASMVEVTLELVDIELEPLLIVKVDPGVYSGTAKTILTSLISTTLNKVKVNGQTPMDFISVIDPNMDVKMDQVLIRSNTLLQALPDYLNNTYGVYTSGIGAYIQRTIFNKEDKMGFYCYPLFNMYRFREKGIKLALVVSNSIEADLSKTSYFIDDNTVRVLATNITTDKDDRSSTDTKTYGSLVDSHSEYNVDREMINSVVVDKKKLTNAFLNEKRTDGIDVIHTRQAMRDSSVPGMMGELSSGFGHNIVLKWSNSDPDLLYPGMPVSVLSVKMGKPFSRTGVVVGNHSVYSEVNTGKGTTHVCTTVITVKVTAEITR